MRVLIDASPLIGGKLGGVGYYCHHLLQAMGRLGTDVQASTFYKRSSKKKIHMPHYEGVDEQTTWYPYHNLWNVVGFRFPYLLPLDYLVNDADLFHGTDSRGLPCKKIKQVVTFHDLAHLRLPDTVSRKDLQMHGLQTPYFCQNSDRIIAVSQSTKNDLVELIGVSPDKIDVIPLAAEASYRLFTQEEKDSILMNVMKKYKLPDKYVLFLGSLHPRKNIPMMLETFALTKQRFSLPHHFVLAGMDLGAKDDILQMIKKHKLQKVVHWLGYVDNEDKPALYTGADLFCFISLFEGFGLPVLEAMQCGTPVLTSNTSSLPEVIGHQDCCVDPRDIEAASAKMGHMLTHADYAETLICHGIERAKLFNWANTATLTVGTYQRAMEV